MKRRPTSPRTVVKTATRRDNDSVGGPCFYRSVAATQGKNARVYLEQWREDDPSEVYVSIEMTRGSARASLGATLSVVQLDAMIELLTVARDRARKAKVIL